MFDHVGDRMGPGAMMGWAIRRFPSALWLLAVLLGAPAPTAAAPPNIVVIMSDDQDYASLAKMPHVNRLLVGKGVLFTNYVTSIAMCCPSRTAHLTGQFGHNNGVMVNAAPPDWLAKEHKLLPTWLRRAGYRTGYFGKYVNFYGSGEVPQLHVPPGWSYWSGIPAPWMHRYYDFKINQNGTLHPFPRSAANYQADVLTRGAVAFLERQRHGTQPFYLQVSYLAPHSDIHTAGEPVLPAPRHQGMFASEPLPRSRPSFNEADLSDKPGFLGRDLLTGDDILALQVYHRSRLEALQAVDEGVRAIVDKLGAIGRLGETYIIYLSDNGWHAGEHRIPDGKAGYYEESIRVPLVIRGPDVPANVKRDQLAANIDLAPTIADLAGARPGLVVDGRSLRPALVGAGGAWRTAMLIDGFITDADGDDRAFDAVRTRRYLYVEHPSGERELYDLRLDPYQVASVAAVASYDAVRADLAGKLDTLRTCRGESCWITAPDRTPSPATD